MKIAIRVKPGSSRNKVGGVYAPSGSAAPALVVATTAPAVDGRANAAVMKLLSKALSVRATDIAVVSGHTARNKVVEIPDECEGAWSALVALGETA